MERIDYFKRFVNYGTPQTRNIPMKRKWTVMIQLSGDNNLSEESVWALTEMRRVGSNDDVAVIAQLDSTIHENTRLADERNGIAGKLDADLMKSQHLRIMRAARAHRRQKGPTFHLFLRYL